ncbi:MFS transporter [Cohnella zeiphila]|uniref:MFS transporter n=1 Tax=Cohnella zeiphila TaxID=2761120 RepID=A0A7X0SSR0_9BACL|nr:MFS transporter [Cohnella zeiphila]MBB6734190.1 MFS transporter [Cohnella zeiphila]
MKLSFRIALLSLAVTATFAPMLAAPAVKLLSTDFPDVSPLLIQWVITLSSIFILPTLFSVSYLSERFSKKSILIVGLIGYLIGGVGPSFVNSMTWILVFRAILGLSIGLVSPTFNSLIAEHFRGEARARMNGLVTAINGIGGAVFLSIGGFIASFGWRSVFLCYLYALVLLALVVLFLPRIPPAGRRVTAGATRLPGTFYVIALLSGLHVMLYFTIPTSFPLFLTESGIGNAQTVGYLSALSLLSIFIAGLVFPVLTKRLKGALVTVGLLLYGLGFLLVGTAHSAFPVFAAVVLIGFGQGLFFPMSFGKTAAVVPQERLTQAISYLLASIYLFQFLCPVFMNAVPKFFAFSSSRQTFIFLAAATGASIVVSLVLAARRFKPRISANR